MKKSECPTEREGEFQITGPMYWKDLSSQGPAADPRNTEDASIRGWTKRARSRVELEQPRVV